MDGGKKKRREDRGRYTVSPGLAEIATISGTLPTHLPRGPVPGREEWSGKGSKLKGRHNHDGDSPRKSGQIRKLIIGVIGFTVLLIGVAMIILPGPATLLIPLGLGILATEFLWARRLIKKVKGTLKTKWEKWRWE